MDDDVTVRLMCCICWERLGPRVRMVDHVLAPFAKCDLCGTAGEDEEIIEYEWADTAIDYKEWVS